MDEVKPDAPAAPIFASKPQRGRPKGSGLRAQAAAAERPPMRERKRRRPVGMDEFDIPKEMIPDNETWEWKNFSIAGKDDPFYVQGMRENGWEPVDATKCRDLVPPGYTGPVMKKGMILMERPKHLTEEAHEEQRQLAMNQVETRVQYLADAPPGTAPRNINPKTVPNIRRNFGRAEIPIDG